MIASWVVKLKCASVRPFFILYVQLQACLPSTKSVQECAVRYDAFKITVSRYKRQIIRGVELTSTCRGVYYHDSALSGNLYPHLLGASRYFREKFELVFLKIVNCDFD